MLVDQNFQLDVCELGISLLAIPLSPLHLPSPSLLPPLPSLLSLAPYLLFGVRAIAAQHENLQPSEECVLHFYGCDVSRLVMGQDCDDRG